MSQLKHPLLRELSKLVEQERTSFKWIDLYSSQFIVDAFSERSKREKNTTVHNDMPDLFDDLPEQIIALNKADIIVLALMCSQLVSQSKTHLDIMKLPQELMASVKVCGYRPSFNSNEELAEGLNHLNQANILRVVACSNIDSNNCLPLDEELFSHQAPLILCENKLYLSKYWFLHQSFEAWLQSRSDYVERLENSLLDDLAETLNKVFPKESAESVNNVQEVNWQAVSAAHTLLNPFSLITGGPGTGKTTTAASLLFLLMDKQQRQASVQTSLHVRLLAPTGKAAVKLADSIRHQLKRIEMRVLGNDLTRLRMSDCLPETGETVHRFLYEMGGLRDSFQRPKRFNGDEVLIRRSEQNSQGQVSAISSSKKPLDVVIVDESSMMDLALMVELVSLMPPTTQLILLGDHYQLPAVDPGQVFTECVQRFSGYQQSSSELASLCRLTGYSKEQLTEFEQVHGSTHSLNKNSLNFQPLCVLRKTFRFDGELKIAADLIKAGELDGFKKRFWCASELYNQGSTVTWYDAELSELPDYANMVNAYSGYFNLVANEASLIDLARQFERFQILCSTLEGPLGVHFINTYIEQRFNSACFPNGKIVGELYHGKAILVTRNHPHLGIYNGDIGFVIKDESSDNLNVHFPITNQNSIIVPPARIKEWQSAYAMTVHKSQGSEYEQVGVVLADYAKELLSRALLYTALTRSQKRCDIWVGDEALNTAFEA